MRNHIAATALILVLQLLRSATCLSCDKTFTYYEEYGQNSFNVSCTDITKGYEHMLSNISITNELSLTVTDSVLENVTPELFKNVRNIKILNMLNCSFEFDRRTAIFSELEKLESLTIKDTHLTLENVTLEGLMDLKHLVLSNNSLSGVERGGFEHLEKLEKLEVVGNHVQDLADLQLCELKSLKMLNLRKNLITSLKQFHFYCLKNSHPLDLHINNVRSAPNALSEPLFNLTYTYDLIDLDLSDNQIVDLGYSLDQLGKLRTLNVGDNRLTSTKYAQFKWLLKLQKLIANNNQLRTIDSRIFVNKTQLNLVDLSKNQLDAFGMSNVPQLKLLNLHSNKMSSIDLSNLPNLKELNLSYNSFKNFDFISLKMVPNLHVLRLTSNLLELRSGCFKNVSSLRYLSLSNNSLNSLSNQIFSNLAQLRVLDLSLNHLRTLQENIFAGLGSLEMLNLSSNAIESLSYRAVEPLKSLRSLDIGSNKLVSIEYDIILSKLPWLSNINIKLNQFTCNNLSRIIEFLKHKHIVYVKSEPLELDHLTQNVAGIPCKSAAASDRLLPAEKSGDATRTWIYFVTVPVALLLSTLTVIVIYRSYIYLKRRRYRDEEFELIID